MSLSELRDQEGNDVASDQRSPEWEFALFVLRKKRAQGANKRVVREKQRVRISRDIGHARTKSGSSRCPARTQRERDHGGKSEAEKWIRMAEIGLASMKDQRHPYRSRDEPEACEE